MRTSKIMTFSVPPAIEEMILKQAEAEHKTISEFLREAVRRYLALVNFEDLHKKGRKASEKKKLKAGDVDKWVSSSRSR